MRGAKYIAYLGYEKETYKKIKIIIIDLQLWLIQSFYFCLIQCVTYCFFVIISVKIILNKSINILLVA